MTPHWLMVSYCCRNISIYELCTAINHLHASQKMFNRANLRDSVRSYAAQCGFARQLCMGAKLLWLFALEICAAQCQFIATRHRERSARLAAALPGRFLPELGPSGFPDGPFFCPSSMKVPGLPQRPMTLGCCLSVRVLEGLTLPRVPSVAPSVPGRRDPSEPGG